MAPTGRDEERKLVTVLFADVSGSTALGERLDPERLRAVLQTYFAAMAPIIESWGGTLEKYIGDAIVAVFGVPIVREDDAERAVHAGLEMLERLEDLNETFRERERLSLRIRIGVNTGEVVAALGAGPGDQLIAGDAVNVAARLQQDAEEGTIIAGERTYRVARRAFRFGESVALELKGKADPVQARAVLGPLEGMAKQQVGLQTAMVGRERELRALLDLMTDACETASPHLVVVQGPAGTGKSRLVREFLAASSRQAPIPNVLAGRCPAAGHGITYWALGEVLREAARISLDDPISVSGEQLRGLVDVALSRLELSADERERTLFALATTAGIALPGNPLDDLEPRLVGDEIARAWPRFASALAAERPTILVIEDLHWAGPPLLEMLERLAIRATGSVLVVTTARPEFREAHPAFATGIEAATWLSLHPLTAAQADDLIDGLLRSSELPDDLRDKILGKAEGNPFFLEEILQRLVDEGALERSGGAWRARPSAVAVDLPDTVHGLLSARIDALPGADKRVLQEAAVAGRIFWEEAVVRLAGDGDVPVALVRLEDRGLIAARPTSTISNQTEYQFKHALVRDVAYAGLPKARRARAHAEYAAWLEQLAHDRPEELGELIAHHYATAVTGEDADLAWADDAGAREATRARAFETLIDAGAAARRRFAIGKALELHDEALALATDDLERGRALAAVGDDHEAAYHGDEALEAYARALPLLREYPEADELRGRVCLLGARMAIVKWGGFRKKLSPAEMEELVDEGLATTDEEETRAWLTALKGQLGMRWLWSGKEDPLELSERIRLGEAGLAAAEELDLPEAASQALRALVLLHSHNANWKRALEIAKHELALAERLPPDQQAFSLFYDAVALMEIAGAYRDASEYAERALELSRELTPHELMHATYTVMNNRYHLGEWTELMPVLDLHLEALAAEPGVGCPFVRGGAHFGTLVLAHRGENEHAEKLASAFEPDFETPGMPEALYAQVLVALGDPHAGREVAERVLASGRAVSSEENAFEFLAMLEALTVSGDWDALEMFLPKARAMQPALAVIGPAADRAAGLALAAGGDRAEAESLLRRAVRDFDELGATFEAARARQDLASVLPAEEGRDELERALDAYCRLGAKPHRDRVEAALATLPA